MDYLLVLSALMGVFLVFSIIRKVRKAIIFLLLAAALVFFGVYAYNEAGYASLDQSHSVVIVYSNL